MSLKAKNITFSYKNSFVLKDISFELQKGKVIAILGQNGAGKSTLLKILAKELKPHKGKIYLNFEDIENFNVLDFARRIGYVSQQAQGGYLSVFDTLLLGRKVHFKTSPSKEDIKKTSKMLKKISLQEKALRPTNSLSGGELQKLLIARALLQESEILLIDEPTNNLDIKNQLEVLSMIKDYTKKNNGLSVLVMHDINLALRYCDEFIFLKNSQILKHGKKDIITSELLEEVYGVKSKICECGKEKYIIFFDIS